jgi:hypothetical protein
MLFMLHVYSVMIMYNYVMNMYIITLHNVCYVLISDIVVLEKFWWNCW